MLFRFCCAMTSVDTTIDPHRAAPAPRGTAWISGLLLAGSGVALFLLYHELGVTDIGYDPQRATSSVFQWLGERWLGDWRATRYAYSHLVPLISLALVWRLRRRLMAAPRQWSAHGFLMVLLALFMHWVGMKAEQTRLSLLSLVVMTWAIPYFLHGRAVARLLLFPCAFLVLALPLNFFDSLTFPLRMFIATASSALLQGVGLTTSRIGSLLVVGGSPGAGEAPATESPTLFLDVSDDSSGIFALGALTAIALLVAYLSGRGAWRRGLFVAAVPVVFVVAHILRVTLVAATFAALQVTPSPRLLTLVSTLLLLAAWDLLLWGLHHLLHADHAARLRRALAAHAPPPPRNW